jgi:beta-glucosidase
MKFPKDFVWGTATSSYQIEGAAYRYGGGLSVWDMMGRQKGKIHHGHTGKYACDHYHRFRQDVALMSEIGLQAYRFSVSWPRVLPEGKGRVNDNGLDFYSRLVDALLENDITPWVTLFHWDYPYSLYCQGGWLNRDSSDWFADYTALVVDKLSDRVSHWMTLNEPQCFIGLGHFKGIHAPGVQMGFAEALLAGHNALLAHGRAVQVIRTRSITEPTIGAALVGMASIPDSDQLQDIEAARKSMFSIREKDFFNNTWFSDPMLLGHYPQDGLELFEFDMPYIHDGDMETIHQSLDFYGTNIYWGHYYRASDQGGYEEVIGKELAVTAMDWPVTPEALYWGPKYLHERYQLPVVITENGMANSDALENGNVHDKQRIDYLDKYISEFGRAIAEGVPALGYFLWSVMDNFEWAEGYDKRFGLTYIDYETQKRILKDSAYWYKQVITCNGTSIQQADNKKAASLA